ncbi:ArsR/SmtB family transcription factor [Methanobacterium alcaliphilum]|uniref:ArsR/SmtB family transcription factor n=1 Tax=Methanobacterium alcaliphilum TaxID=392018 RepID=UPI00200AC3B5|nr:metalloregulator ArsR/SmtB family transcription factor [Methanobacterium alcaliphilum]MCK9152267.1 metalloregulator ArsR/SmtB family transcription factor [Methanobacterium alcaliphilum]
MENNQISDETKSNKTQSEIIKKLREALPDKDQSETYARKLKALSDPTRLEILYLLSDGELCVCRITPALDKPQSSVSRHLNILKNLGFIKSRKEGARVYYKLTNPKIAKKVKELIELI